MSQHIKNSLLGSCHAGSTLLDQRFVRSYLELWALWNLEGWHQLWIPKDQFYTGWDTVWHSWNESLRHKKTGWKRTRWREWEMRMGWERGMNSHLSGGWCADISHGCGQCSCDWVFGKQTPETHSISIYRHRTHTHTTQKHVCCVECQKETLFHPKCIRKTSILQVHFSVNGVPCLPVIFSSVHGCGWNSILWWY